MTTREQVADAIEARAGMYETLASLYFDTLTQEQIDAMAAQDFTALMEDENEQVASGFNDIFRYLRKRNTGTRQELSMDFSSCFLGTHAYKGFVAQPYESLFRDTSGLLSAPPRAEVHRAYKAERVSLRAGYDYPEDHIAFECEFLAILCRRSAQSLREGDDAEALRVLGVQADFLENHLNQWFRKLHDLSLRFVKTRFYRGVLSITQGFLDGEPDAIAELREAVEAGLEDAADAPAGDEPSADGAQDAPAEQEA